MPEFVIRDPKTGREWEYRGDAAPSEEEVNQIIDYGQDGSNARGFGKGFMAGAAGLGADMNQLAEWSIKYSPFGLLEEGVARGVEKFTGWKPPTGGSVASSFFKPLIEEGRAQAGEYSQEARLTGAHPFFTAAGETTPALLSMVAGGAGLAAKAPTMVRGAIAGGTTLLSFARSQDEAEKEYYNKFSEKFPDLTDNELSSMAKQASVGPAAAMAVWEGALTYAGGKYGWEGSFGAKKGATEAAKALTKAQIVKKAATSFGSYGLAESLEELGIALGHAGIKGATFDETANPYGPMTDKEIQYIKREHNPDLGVLTDENAESLARERRVKMLLGQLKTTAQVAFVFGGTGGLVTVYGQNAQVKADAKAAGANAQAIAIEQAKFRSDFENALSKSTSVNVQLTPHDFGESKGLTSQNFTSLEALDQYLQDTGAKVVPKSVPNKVLSLTQGLPQPPKAVSDAIVAMNSGKLNDAESAAAGKTFNEWFNSLSREQQSGAIGNLTAISHAAASGAARQREQASFGVPDAVIEGKAPFTVQYINGKTGQVERTPTMKSTEDLTEFLKKTGAQPLRGTYEIVGTGTLARDIEAAFKAKSDSIQSKIDSQKKVDDRNQAQQQFRSDVAAGEAIERQGRENAAKVAQMREAIRLNDEVRQRSIAANLEQEKQDAADILEKKELESQEAKKRAIAAIDAENERVKNIAEGNKRLASESTPATPAAPVATAQKMPVDYQYASPESKAWWEKNDELQSKYDALINDPSTEGSRERAAARDLTVMTAAKALNDHRDLAFTPEGRAAGLSTPAIIPRPAEPETKETGRGERIERSAGEPILPSLELHNNALEEAGFSKETEAQWLAFNESQIKELVELPVRPLVRRVLGEGNIPWSSNAYGPGDKGVWFQTPSGEQGFYSFEVKPTPVTPTTPAAATAATTPAAATATTTATAATARAAQADADVIIAKMDAFYQKSADEVKRILKGRGTSSIGRLAVALPANIAAAVTAKGAVFFYKGAKSYPAWHKLMVSEFGLGIRPYLRNIHKEIQDPDKLSNLNITVIPKIEASQEARNAAKAMVAQPLNVPMSKQATIAKELMIQARVDADKAAADAGKSPPGLSLEIGMPRTLFSRLASSTRGLSQELHQKMQESIGFINKHSTRARRNLNDLNNALIKDWGVGYVKLPNESKSLIDNVLTGKIPSTALPPNVAIAIDNELAQRAELQQKLLNAIPNAPDGLIAKIVGNSGYLHRSYRAFTEEGWIKRLQDDTEGSNAPVTNEGKALIRKANKMVQKGRSKNQAEARSKILRRLVELRSGATSVAGLTSDPIVQVDSDGNLVSVNAGTDDSSVLKRRNNIDEDYRTMLGEETDPQAKYLETVRKVAHAVAYRKWITDLLSDGIRTGRISHKSDNVDGHNVALNSKISVGDDPLSGYYSTDEYAKILSEFNDAVKDINPLLRLVSRLTMFSKLNMTAGSLTYIPQQVYGSINNLITIGSLLSFKGMPARVRDVLRAEFGKNPKATEKFMDEMVGLGIIGNTNLDADSYEILHDLATSRKGVVQSFYDIAASRGARGLKFFSSIDDAVKILGYLSELDVIQKAYPTMNPEAAKSFAAIRTSHRFPSKSTLPKGFRTLSEIPGIGDFISFHVLTHYNLIQSVRYGLLDIKNPKMRSHGVNSLVSAAVAIASADILIAMFEAMMGTNKTEDEERAFRATKPVWARKADYMFYRDKDGKLNGVNLTIVNPLSSLRMAGREILSGATGEQSIVKSVIEGSKRMLEPFTNSGAVASAYIDAYRGQTEYGRRVWETTDDTSVKLIKSIEHLVRKTMLPASVNRYNKNIDPAMTGERKAIGNMSSVNQLLVRELLGFDPSTLHPEIALRETILRFNQSESHLTSLFLKEITSPKNKTPQEIVELRARLEKDRRQLFFKTRGDYSALVNAGKLGKDSIIKAFREAGAKNDILNFREGTYVPYLPSADFRSTIIKANMEREESARIGNTPYRPIKIPDGLFRN